MAAATRGAAPPPRTLLADVRRDAAALQRFAALNYVAVVKACKKRDRRLGASPPTALAALADRAFFASPRLAALITAVDVAAAEADMAGCSLACAAASPPSAAGELGCAVCLARLRQPVVLTCGHRFCWACATGAAGAAVARRGVDAGKCDGDAVAVAPADDDDATFWPCPTCRKPQPWDKGPTLEVDAHLERLLMKLASGSPERPASGGRPASATTTAAASPPPLLPPRDPDDARRLTVVLDLDGTLAASFPPSRAGALLSGRGGGAAYIVGVGSSLNPDGIVVVERPGLGPFLRQLSAFAEVVMFTAGLPKYGAHLADALFARHGAPEPHLRLYRPATVAAAAFPCVKNLAALGRDPSRTLLVDDTPLAFLAQPSSGVPVVPWRGDGRADTVLVDALLPLLRDLAAVDGDIRPMLESRFGMPAWFATQGLECGEGVLAKPVAEAAPASPTARPLTPSTDEEEEEDDGDSSSPPPRPLAVFDFDHTLTDIDIGFDVVSTLAPELAPQLAHLTMPANFVPATNAVLREAARRGVCRESVLAAARRAGLGLSGGGAAALRTAAAVADVCILSDANSVFIGAALAAAGLTGVVGGVVTNAAAFEPMPAGAGATHHLVITPRQSGKPAHGCKHCPENLCKGLELGVLRREGGDTTTSTRRRRHRRVIYSGDGENDLCPSLRLVADDAVLVRRGRGLERLLRERGVASSPRSDTPPRSPVLAAAVDAGLAGGLAPGVAAYVWSTRDELAALVEALLE